MVICFKSSLTAQLSLAIINEASTEISDEVMAQPLTH